MLNNFVSEVNPIFAFVVLLNSSKISTKNHLVSTVKQGKFARCQWYGVNYCVYQQQKGQSSAMYKM